MHPKFKVGERVLTHPGPYQAVGTVATVLPIGKPGKAHQYVLSLNDSGIPGGCRYQIFEEDMLSAYQDPSDTEREALQDEIDELNARVDNLITQNDDLMAENYDLKKTVELLKDSERKIRDILWHPQIDD